MKKDAIELWFVTGSQHLYGEETLKQVNSDSRAIATALDKAEAIPLKVVFQPVLTTAEAITSICIEANNSPVCAGLIAWMHTFSPAKMWISGLKKLNKPLLHFHTQYNRDIPWPEINMDFMNLNQAAHGDREFGYICSRLRLERKVVVGHWQDKDAVNAIGVWSRAAMAALDARSLKVARFGDNMRDVAVTEGNKVSAQLKLDYQVHGYGVGDLANAVSKVSDKQVASLVKQYGDEYKASSKVLASPAIKEAARIEIGMRTFLEKGGFKAFTTTFEDLHGLVQLPGLAVQRLMADGYGFGAEGDWKTSALVHAMKVMAAGLKGGVSFMEDYTYHFSRSGDKALGAHMLEVCPSIASGRPRLEIQQLSIGGKADPARLLFDTKTGPAVNASIMDMGNRFRMVVNDVEVVPTDAPLPKLPVARALWIPQPSLKIAAAAWILAGGAHHTGFSQAVTAAHLQDFADMADMECLLINKDTDLAEFKKELRWNDVYYLVAKGL